MLESKTVTSNGKTKAYAYDYDEDAEHKSVNITDGAGLTSSESYGYDVNKNLVSRESANGQIVTSRYGPLDKLQQVGDISYAFNVDGQLTRRERTHSITVQRTNCLKLPLTAMAFITRTMP